MNSLDETVKTIRPFWGHGRAAIVKSTVEEADHGGIIVPIAYDGDDGIERGVIVGIARAPEYDGYADPRDDEPLTPGTVVYYRRGVKILDVLIVDLHDVIAYEESS